MSEPEDLFEKAKFYDCDDGEVLTCETPEEALVEYLEALAGPGSDVVALIANLSPITVRAFIPSAPDDSWISSGARHLLDQAADFYSEKFSDPDGNGDDTLHKDAYDAVMPAMIAALRTFYSYGDTWYCDKIAERVYDAATVERVLREHCPEWFIKRKAE